DALEHSLHLRIALVAVLRAAIVATIRFRVLEERGEVADAVALDAADQAIGVVRAHRERHVTAVRLAVDGDAILVEIRLLPDPIEQRADVLDAVFALLRVVEIRVALAVTGAATHILQDHGRTEHAREVLRTDVP